MVNESVQADSSIRKVVFKRIRGNNYSIIKGLVAVNFYEIFYFARKLILL